MKIYFADTIQREYLGQNEKFKCKNNLESYYSIILKKPFIQKWWLVKEKMTKEIKHKNFLGAYNKGVKAKQYGLLLDSNPYQDKKNSKGRSTWSKIFRKYWIQGWDDSKISGFGILKKK